MNTQDKIITLSILTCPNCKNQTEEEMPTNACKRFHTCLNCNFFIKPITGDCCVFCSFGTNTCPPKQIEDRCC